MFKLKPTWFEKDSGLENYEKRIHSYFTIYRVHRTKKNLIFKIL